MNISSLMMVVEPKHVGVFECEF